MFCQSIVYFMLDLFIFLEGNLFKKSENVYVTVCGGEQQLEIKALVKKVFYTKFCVWILLKFFC